MDSTPPTRVSLVAAISILALVTFVTDGTAQVRIAVEKPESITLRASWEPCRESKYGLFAENPILRSVAPARPLASHDIALAAAFLPENDVRVGDVWPVERRAIVPLLRQFDPSASAVVDPFPFESAGTFGCLVGLDARYAYVVTRSHAKFHLDGEVVYRPAQFEGHWWIDHVARELVAVTIALPDRNPNVDVNCPKEMRVAGEKHPRTIHAADIGWVPRMSLTMGTAPGNIEWTESVAIEDARRKLAREFYAFASIDWIPFDEAVLASREQRKPLHVIVLFGTLDDAAC